MFEVQVSIHTLFHVLRLVLELTAVLLPQILKYWDYRHKLPYQVLILNFYLPCGGKITFLNPFEAGEFFPHHTQCFSL